MSDKLRPVKCRCGLVHKPEPWWERANFTWFFCVRCWQYFDWHRNNWRRRRRLSPSIKQAQRKAMKLEASRP